jgi:hypothetical protein
MDGLRETNHPRSQHFLDTVAFGSLLVFASVMPPRSPQDAASRQVPHPEGDEERLAPRPERAA